MANFKVGDRVRAKESDSELKPRFVKGAVGTITADSSSVFMVKWDYPYGCRAVNGFQEYGGDADCSEYNLELAYTLTGDQEAKSKLELERLVERANEGAEACKIIRSQYPNEVESRYNKGDFEPFSGDYDGFHFRIKLGPAFEPFEVGTGRWKVELIGKEIKIGCKHYDAFLFASDLRFVSKGEGLVYNLKATREGVKDGQHTINWAESDKLLEVLTRAGF